MSSTASTSKKSRKKPITATTEGFNASLSVSNANASKSVPLVNQGGCRPLNLNLTEEEKLKDRRERHNKAAAKYRKKFRYRTHELYEEVGGLVQEKLNLATELYQLAKEKEELLHLLGSHREFCRFQVDPNSPLNIKPNIASMENNKSSTISPLLAKVQSEPIDSIESEPAPKK